MKTIWIVEYGYYGFTKAECFCAAFSTQRKANEYAQQAAEDQKECFEDGGMDDGEECVIKATIDGNGSSFRGTYVGNRNEPSDWWIVREVPFE